MEKVARIAIYLCVLIILNEFGPAHFRRLHPQKTKAVSRARNHKRWTGAVATLGKYIFKALEIGSKYFKDLTTVVTIISTVYSIVQKCEDTEYGAESKTYMDEAKTITNEIDAGSSQINSIQLETENLQLQIETLNYHFNETLNEMEEAGYLSQNLLETVSPEIQAGVHNATLELEEQLRKANETEATVDYATVSKLYAKRIDKVVNIAVPIFTSAIPRIPKILEFGKTRYQSLKSFELTKKFPQIKLPTVNTKPFTAMKSWFAKPKSFLASAQNKLRGKVTFSYDKAKSLVKNFGKAFSVLSTLVFAAYDIYTIVTNFQQKQCRETRDQAKAALQKVKEAKATYDDIITNATNAKNDMIAVKDQMVAEISNEVFLEDLKNMNKNMKEIQGDRNGMQEMIDATEMYINEIPGNTDIDQIGQLMLNLYQNAIASLPSVYRCVNERTGLIGYVARECKEGLTTLQVAIEKGRKLFNYEIEKCEQRTGIPFFESQALEEMIDQASVQQGFKKECKLNNKFITNNICTFSCDAKKAQEISDVTGVSLEGVNEVLATCPPCEIDEVTTKKICALVNNGMSRGDIQSTIFPQFTVEQIEAVSCD